ncbi:hypothetical protein SEA_STROSAHL_1 [Gordonia phage Strosahl]|uniref:Uncharacterized protein n=3 Tax=Soupsvirus TaxID=1982562 RepID=A0A1B3B129_9CAUD|nr:nuclease [Gordonia phage Remus]YP_009285945.1 nuclease [Gordonia phage JSwag]YP_009596205.1 nuclease [Gordonia phage Strosahl]YP_009624519.1 nuclease [Gordonia phage Waits]AXH47802.1 hypothetical protein SEA_LASTRESORT_1 [Gordonia phage LastResort]QDM56180.1 hypothetical protein SEA_REMO_1 [Gordonia phage ReMo]QLF84878.1 hypothetical protein SEA_EPSOCAMISIO_1 [Gordonia phage Epsocamisio]QZD98652.1 hypothetical protein SEA_LOOPER_1 [Gordonia phage Looper]UAJ15496.1 hypothetical protein SE
MFGTRTSQYWQSQPGKFDVLNLRRTFESSNPHGIPDLQPTQFVPANLAAWNMPRHRDHAAVSGGALHFFLDDYRFETVWSSPERLLPRVKAVGAALTPDFSLWRDMPRAAQVWNIYRSRWCGAYWQSEGLTVIPTATWGTPDTYDFCFDGLPVGGSIAISSMGIRTSGEDQELFRMGLEQLVARTSPSTLIAYGKLRFCDGLDLPEVREYPTFWDRRRKQVQQWADEAQEVADPPADDEHLVEEQELEAPSEDLQAVEQAEVEVLDLDHLDRALAG